MSGMPTRASKLSWFAPLDLGAHQFSGAGAVRHEAALPEHAASHHQQVAISINVAQAEPAGLSGAQTEPVAETEDDAICGTALVAGRAAAAANKRRAWTTRRGTEGVRRSLDFA